MAVNVKLLKKVRRLIAEEPRRLRMCVWARKVKPTDKIKPPCGTVACLAGWTILANAARKDWDSIVGTQEYSIDRYARSKQQYIAASPVEQLAAELLGIERYACPFREFKWNAAKVLAWIDKKIAAKA